MKDQRKRFFTKDGEIKRFQCGRCLRLFVKKGPHRCNGNLRKRNINWTEFSEDEILVFSLN